MSSKKVLVTEGGQLTFSELAPKPFKERLAVDSSIIPSWTLIQTVEEWQQALPEIMSCPVVGLDIETTGLSSHDSKVRLVQIGISSKHVYICDMFALKDFSLLKPVLEANRPVKIIHNAPFELSFLYCKHKLPMGTIFDTLLASQLIYAGYGGLRHSLFAVAMRELKIMMDKELQTSNWELETLSNAQLDYAALDASILIPLRQVLVKKLKDFDLVQAAKLEFDCTKAVTAMMHHGVGLNMEYLAKKQQELEERKVALVEDLSKELGNINLNSHQQVAKSLRSMGIIVRSTRERELQKHISTYPILRALLEYKSITKELNTFVIPLQERRNPITHRVHPRFFQNGTVAGRMSCSSPNMQNIPRGEFRQAIVPAKGHKLIIADYSQVELRIAAEMAGDKTMIRAYREGKDLHKLTASIVAGKPIEEITKEERQKAKAVNFGLIYGMGAEGLVSYARYSYGVEMSKAEAENTIRTFFEKYKGLSMWHRRSRQDGRERRYTQTLSGRKRFIEEGREVRDTDLYNTPVQGTGADILKAALIKLHAKLRPTDAKIVNCVHDEIVVECPDDIAEDIAVTVEREMVSAGEQFLKQVPVVVEVVIADSWAEK